MTAASISVVIPAHNEEQVIARTLTSLLAGASAGELEIVVACNGCTDRTAQIAAGYDGVEVVEVAQASKAAALNAGDARATAFPRVFLDADVEVDIGTLRCVRDALRGVEARAAAPRLAVDLSRCSPAVAAYYTVWTSLPYVKAGLLGTGFYALSEAGRARFEVFPDVVADDLFVQRLFSSDERLVTEGTFLVRPPRTLGSLLRSKTRVYAGNLQYAEALAAGTLHATVASTARSAGTPGTRAAILELARQPVWWRRLFWYGLVVLVSRGRAETRVRRGRTTRWDQDTTGRAA